MATTNKNNIPLDDLLTLPEEMTWENDEDWFVDKIQNNSDALDDNPNSPIKKLRKFPEEPTPLEIEKKMNPRTVTSIKDLRPDDYSGFSLNILKF